MPERVRLEIDTNLVAQARALTGIADTSSLVDQALRALIEREAALRLSRFGASQPDLEGPPRRR